MRDRFGEEIEAPVHDPFAIAHCEFCNEHGMRGLHRCNHIDYAAAAKRGKALCIQQLKKGGK